ncbi:exodeoxyribonuclease V subunit gamma [Allochromatium palmeri]|uniref:RecBCD enzyme subunit RecC n=1 Tax=Allochromatium palmeri TaxID=231048 RepID=A0A6N8ECL5_9GAMM|nr:exodeoxyribonuclease V subunit gamma [Allochromatium palmeri]MTW21311.1 exodeoxyribonuclease V subunit gamma [Allochromatium palmeri]
MHLEDPHPPTDWPTGFMLIQGNRLEELRALLVAWMQRHPLAPLENETILVQSNGIAQWLKLALAATPARNEHDAITGGQGIAAALDVMLPARFIWRLYRAVLGDLPETSPFDKAPLTWRLYRLLERLTGEVPLQASDTQFEALAPLRGFLAVDGADAAPRRRYQLAERLADLLDQYQVYRANWLEAWSENRDILIRSNGKQQPVPEGQAWQPVLWRALQADVNAEFGPDDPALRHASRAKVHQIFLERVRGAGADQTRMPVAALQAAELPRRVIVFGISSLPRQMLEVLEAIAPVSQVILFVLNPSRHYWGDLIEGRDLFRRPYRRHAARKVPEDLDERDFHLHGHPLLAAWGKQGRDYIRLLDEHDERRRYEAHFQGLVPGVEGIDLFASPGTDCLLHQLQDDILELRPLKERQDKKTAINPERDRSLEFIVAHSPQREIEILHDRLLDEFERSAHSTHPLQPREVLVMVPDIAVHAPHIQAVFGRFDPDDRRYIPFQVTDQGQRHRNPLVIGLEHLLNLPRARFAVSELLDLLDIPALRTRLDLDESDLPQLRSWIAGANVRWGLDAAQRASLGLPEGLEQNTWHFGLRRLLLGFASGGAGPWRDIEPHDEIGGLEAARLGPLACLLERLEDYWQRLTEPRPPAGWVALVGELLDDFFAESSESDGVTLARILLELDAWADDCVQGGLGAEPIALDIFREAFLARLDQPSLTQRFLAGAVNFATLMPMRAIPFRQIWLLGMNDGDYPRRRVPADFDLMAGDYRPGDRSRREDDRYLFLEALLSAREKLVVGWVGRGIRDNSERPPSVLVGQLRDHLAAGWRRPDGDGAGLLAALTSVHPLQPFGRGYFEPGRAKTLFTYAREWRAVHDGAGATEVSAERLAPWLPETPVDLDQLQGFLRDPIMALFDQRLRIKAPGEVVAPPDVETFALDGLGDWQIKDELISRTFEPGLDRPALEQRLQAGIARFQAQGRLPDGSLGERLGQTVIAYLPVLHTAWDAALSEWPRRLDRPIPVMVEVNVPAGRLVLEDVLSDLREGDDGRGQIILQTSGLTKDKHYQWRNTLRAWVRHLAAQLDGEPVTTRLLTPSGDARLEPVPVDEARERLESLLVVWWEGMQRPLPVALNAGMAWLDKDGPETLEDGTVPEELKAWNAALQAFDLDHTYNAYVGRCYDSFEALWSGGEFARWAHRLYGGLRKTISR